MMEQGLRDGYYRWRYRKSLAKEHSGDYAYTLFFFFSFLNVEFYFIYLFFICSEFCHTLK